MYLPPKVNKTQNSPPLYSDTDFGLWMDTMYHTFPWDIVKRLTSPSHTDTSRSFVLFGDQFQPVCPIHSTVSWGPTWGCHQVTERLVRPPNPQDLENHPQMRVTNRHSWLAGRQLITAIK